MQEALAQTSSARSLRALVVGASESAAVELHEEIKSLVQVKIMEHDREYSKISQALLSGATRIEIAIGFLDEIVPDLSKKMVEDPTTFYPPLEEAVNDIARQLTQLNDSKSKMSISSTAGRLRVGFKGWLGSNSITPRGIRSDLANTIVLVEGIVTRCTPPASKLKMATYFIPELGRHVFREYSDKYAMLPIHKQKLMATGLLTSDADGRSVELEYGLSEYKDYQWLTLQEMPEITPLGQLPRSVEILAECDLVDKTKPGDRARVCGILKTFTHANGAVLSGGTSVCIVANYIQQLQIDHMTRTIEPSMIKLYKELANDPQTLDLVASSIAPAISGHRRVRQGLALQLAGGVTQDAPDGLRRRGDIHVLLLGDPSCGKSQMLRYALRLAPLAVSTTGRGSSAVGLTAAVTKDALSGHQRLEAGAMVLADRGMVCIDEFDKMGHDDRSAVHEVMEQQKVTVFKANISAVLNARTSVLAAANPIYGHFNDNMDFAKQINFPDSLLSRFDLIFLIRESASAAEDRKIAQQVLSQLRAIKKDALEDTRRQRAMRADVSVPTLLQPRRDKAPEKEKENVPLKQLMWQHDETAVGRGKGKLSGEAVRSAKASRLLKPEFLKEFLVYCRFSVSPTLSENAEEEIAEFYGYLREKIKREWEKTGIQRAVPTPRLLEALIRLSTAHAKLKLKTVVDTDDVNAAKSLIVYTLLGMDDSEEAEAEAAADAAAAAEAEARPAARNKRQRGSSAVEALSDQSEQLDIDEQPKKRRAGDAPPALMDVAENTRPPGNLEVDQIWAVINSLKDSTGEEDWDVQHVFKLVKKAHKSLDQNTYQEVLKKLQVQNLIMIVGQRCYLV